MLRVGGPRFPETLQVEGPPREPEHETRCRKGTKHFLILFVRGVRDCILGMQAIVETMFIDYIYYVNKEL